MSIYFSLALLFLLSLLYFLVISVGIGFLTLFDAVVTGLISSQAWRLTEGLKPRNLGTHSTSIAAGACFLGVLVSRLLEVPGSGLIDWVGILVAGGAAAATGFLQSRGVDKKCFVCRKPVTDNDSVACPRCEQQVCMRPDCWDFARVRCSLCRDREVVVLPDEETWWSARVGQKLTRGQCDSCFKEAHEADLRECGQCHWPMCRRCWDSHNGSCPRCGWMIPDLPARLRPFLHQPRRHKRQVR
jgi:hypothetical protein